MKKMTSGQMWQELLEQLTPRPKLYAWSAVGKAHSCFGILSVLGGGITVQTSKGPRCIPRKDFERIFVLWNDYVAGRVQRQTLRNISVNSTYVLGILHWLQIQPGMES